MATKAWKVICGKLLGLERNQIKVINEETGESKDVDIRGRWLYCRQTRLSESIRGIILPDAYRDGTSFLTVFAIGSGCDKFNKVNKQLKQHRDMKNSISLGDLDVLDQILTPNNHEFGIMRSPWNLNWDFFIHENIIKAYIKGDKNA